MKKLIIRPLDSYLVKLSEDTIPSMETRKLISDQMMLASHEEVLELIPLSENVFQNFEIEFPLDPSNGASLAEQEDNWGIGEKGLDVEQFWGQGITGKGILLGIADSGLDITLPTFMKILDPKKKFAFAEFDKNGLKIAQTDPTGQVIPDSLAKPTASHWHGTFCASIIAGHNDGKKRGVAPEASLVIAKVLQQGNIGTTASIFSGLTWLAEQQCDVISLSLGWPGKHDVWREPIERMLKNGAVVVAAIGNENGIPGIENTRSPANYFIAKDDYPGMLISVGAHDAAKNVADFSGGGLVDWSNVTNMQPDGQAQPTVFSNNAPFMTPDLLAPGVDIVQPITIDRYESASGSSMATPHIAGLIGLILSAIRSVEPTAAPKKAAELVLDCLEVTQGLGQDRAGRGTVNVAYLFEQVSNILSKKQ
ncbi:TPA: S8 family peptidase [Citrobacter freundii]